MWKIDTLTSNITFMSITKSLTFEDGGLYRAVGILNSTVGPRLIRIELLLRNHQQC